MRRMPSAGAEAELIVEIPGDYDVVVADGYDLTTTPDSSSVLLVRSRTSTSPCQSSSKRPISTFAGRSTVRST